ncbi:MAG: hypothetical protein ACKOYN_05140, partial [Planctomycetota bacterium]
MLRPSDALVAAMAVAAAALVGCTAPARVDRSLQPPGAPTTVSSVSRSIDPGAVDVVGLFPRRDVLQRKSFLTALEAARRTANADAAADAGVLFAAF